MSLGKVPKRKWCQARYEQPAEHAGIHGNPESGNHPGACHTDSISGDTYNPHTYPDH